MRCKLCTFSDYLKVSVKYGFFFPTFYVLIFNLLWLLIPQKPKFYTLPNINKDNRKLRAVVYLGIYPVACFLAKPVYDLNAASDLQGHFHDKELLTFQSV